MLRSHKGNEQGGTCAHILRILACSMLSYDIVVITHLHYSFDQDQQKVLQKEVALTLLNWDMQ